MVKTGMEIAEIIEFLKTDTLSATFTSEGLKFLSLKTGLGTLQINLLRANNQGEDPLGKLLLEETMNLFETGKHDLPLDLTDFTPFQQRVFEAVSRIERGRIITYKGIAEILGKPGGAQAVGSAIARNPVSYFLPTHRVLPQRGIGICRSGAGHLRERLLVLEGHDLAQLMGNYICTRKDCHRE